MLSLLLRCLVRVASFATILSALRRRHTNRADQLKAAASSTGHCTPGRRTIKLKEI
jgi:hypothetical protein